MEGGGEGGVGRARKEMGKGKTSCDGDFLGFRTGTFYLRRLVVEVVIICKRILLYYTTGEVYLTAADDRVRRVLIRLGPAALQSALTTTTQVICTAVTQTNRLFTITHLARYMPLKSRQDKKTRSAAK